MASALGGILKIITRILDKIGGLALTLMMLLTVADVLLRATGRPLVGTYEVVALSLALVIGFTIPKVSLDRGHIRVDLVIERVSRRDEKHPEYLHPADLYRPFPGYQLQPVRRCQRAPGLGGSVSDHPTSRLPPRLRRGRLLFHRVLRVCLGYLQHMGGRL